MQVFVTTELYPFTAGGIGRVISNILNSEQNNKLNNFLIVMAGRKIDTDQFSEIYPNVKFAQCLEEDYTLIESEDNAAYPPKWAFSNSHFHYISVALLQTLISCQKNTENLIILSFLIGEDLALPLYNQNY